MKSISKFLLEAKDTKKAVKGIITHDGDVIILRRANDHSGGGNWDLPGGHIKDDETPVEGLRREVREETGLEIVDIKKFKNIDIVIPEENIDSNLMLYKAEVSNGNIDVSLKIANWQSPPAPEHTEYKWVKYQDELERLPMVNSMKKAIMKYLATRSNP